MYMGMNMYVNTNRFKEAAVTSESQIAVHSYGIGGE
jgi:hypothetical protein